VSLVHHSLVWSYILFNLRLTIRLAIAIFAAIGCWGLTGTAHAQITVSKSVLEFNDDNLIQDVDVINNGDFKIFLNLTVARIKNPQSANPERIELKDPRTSPVLISPKQILVPPGQRKRVRVVMRKIPTKTDAIYRLSVKPFTGAVQINQERKPDEKASALKILLGYDILLLARPKDAVGKLAVKRTSKAIYFKNTGNTNVLLRRMLQCNSDGTDCDEMQPNRIYAGEIYKVKLPKKGSAKKYPIQVWQAVGLKNTKKTY